MTRRANRTSSRTVTSCADRLTPVATAISIQGRSSTPDLQQAVRVERLLSLKDRPDQVLGLLNGVLGNDGPPDCAASRPRSRSSASVILKVVSQPNGWLALHCCVCGHGGVICLACGPCSSTMDPYLCSGGATLGPQELGLWSWSRSSGACLPCSTRISFSAMLALLAARGRTADD